MGLTKGPPRLERIIFNLFVLFNLHSNILISVFSCYLKAGGTPTTTNERKTTSMIVSDNLLADYVKPFPLPLVVGHNLIKRALLLGAINPHRIGGIIIQGRRGAGKSVLARSIASIFPAKIERVKGSRFNVDPKFKHGVDDFLLQNIMKTPGGFSTLEEMNIETEWVKTPYVQVPLNAMEDNLIGTVDLEESIKVGRTIFEPGILANAHRGVLFVDDINLLDEETANILLNVINRGYVVVEREGVSFQYPCKPLLIATFNPEEGELRSNILDRIGLSLSVDMEPLTVDQRVKVVDNVCGYSGGKTLQDTVEANERLVEARRTEDKMLKLVVEGRKIKDDVLISKEQILYICKETTRAGCKGQRGEIFAVEAAKTNAALEGRKQVNASDLRLAVQLCLLPRCTFIDRVEEEEEIVPREKIAPPQPVPSKDLPPKDEDRLENEEEEKEEEKQEDKEDVSPEEEELEIPPEFMFSADSVPMDPSLMRFAKWTKRGRGGKRSRIFNLIRGRFVKSIFPKGKRGRLAVGATLRAAAPYQVFRRKRAEGTAKAGKLVYIHKEDFRIKWLAKKAGSLVIFVVDASGSMALNRMNVAKGAAISLLSDAYKNRDQICLISFHDIEADVLVPPTKSMALTKNRLEAMPCGAGTPLAHALTTAIRTGINAKKSKDIGKSIIVLITDGRANIPMCMSMGEPFDPAVMDPFSVDGIPSRKFLKDEVLAVAKQLRGIKDCNLLVIDTEPKFLSTGLAEELARVAGGNYFQVDSGTSIKTLKDIVKEGMTGFVNAPAIQTV